MPRMSLRSPKRMSKSASIEREHCYARVSTRELEWKGKKHSIFMPRGVIGLLRMCLKEFRSRTRRRKTPPRGCSDSPHGAGSAGCPNTEESALTESPGGRMATKEIPIAGYGSKLLSRVEVAEGTMAFHFEKPSRFDFKPGQSADVTLFNPPETDSEGNTRTFSIASSPFENQLMFATRMRDTAFKRSLKKVPLGIVVKMASAMGSFTLHKNSAKPAVFLAGGIGITPFSSIVRQADHDRPPHKLYLFYSNRRPEDAPFIEVLQNLEKTNPKFRFIATMTEMPRSKKTWNGETGWINQEMLSKYLNDLRGPIYYIAGPPAIVSGMRKMLVASGVDEDDIRTEEFAGY